MAVSWELGNDPEHLCLGPESCLQTAVYTVLAKHLGVGFHGSVLAAQFQRALTLTLLTLGPQVDSCGLEADNGQAQHICQSRIPMACLEHTRQRPIGPGVKGQRDLLM
jgi:hypothetical protein